MIPVKGFRKVARAHLIKPSAEVVLLFTTQRTVVAQFTDRVAALVLALDRFADQGGSVENHTADEGQWLDRHKLLHRHKTILALALLSFWISLGIYVLLAGLSVWVLVILPIAATWTAVSPLLYYYTSAIAVTRVVWRQQAWRSVRLRRLQYELMLLLIFIALGLEVLVLAGVFSVIAIVGAGIALILGPLRSTPSGQDVLLTSKSR
jgi:hypothetical protein